MKELNLNDIKYLIENDPFCLLHMSWDHDIIKYSILTNKGKLQITLSQFQQVNNYFTDKPFSKGEHYTCWKRK